MNTAAEHIRVENLTMAYGDFVLMRDLNFTVNRADIFIIMGGSGCGKSTLARCLAGLIPHLYHGELSGRENVFLNGAILGMKRAEIARKFDAIVAV